MSGPPNGKYLIRLASGPRVVVGAIHDGGPTDPVVVGGPDNIWTVTQLPDDPRKYTLILEETGTSWLSQDNARRVVVGIMPSPWFWSIQGDGPYTIETPGPIRPTTAWTLENFQPGTPVILDLAVPVPPQLWEFIPANE